MNEPLETAELLAFVKIVEARSLSRAALELGVPRATLGRRLARLETRLSTRLLRRTTRSIAITDAGELLYQRARLVLEAVAQAEASVRNPDDAVRGDLRISVPPLNTPEFGAMLLAFAARYPEVRLHVDYSTRHVDLHREGYDVAIRGSNLPIEPGLIAKVLGRGRLVAVASPAYLKANGTPTSVRDLLRHRCLMGFARGTHAQTHWPRQSGKPVKVQGVLFTNDLLLLAQAAAEGAGIAMLPTFITQPLIETKELVHVLPTILGAESRASIVFAERELMAPQVRAFVDWATQRVPAILERQPKRCEEAVAKRTRTG
jgi:DNA-binding transcriptional LysR family regulator